MHLSPITAPISLAIAVALLVSCKEPIAAPASPTSDSSAAPATDTAAEPSDSAPAESSGKAAAIADLLLLLEPNDEPTKRLAAEIREKKAPFAELEEIKEPNGGPGGFELGLPQMKVEGREVDAPHPKLVEVTPRVSGALDDKTVQQYIRRYLLGIKWCYQDRLQSNPELAGKVTLAFTIIANGTTHEPRVEDSSLGDAMLETCMTTKMARWRFPQPKDGVVEVAYPLILKTE